MIDIALEVVRALVLLGIVLFLWTAGRGRFELTRTGWNFIIGGFGLLLFGSVVDITDNFEYLNRFVVIGDTETEAILEKFVGFLGGFVLLAIGLVRWIPSVQRLSDEIDKGGRTAEALRASETQVRLLMDSTAEAIYGIDLKGDCSFANPACAKMLGYDGTEELLGKHMHDLIHHTRSDGTHYPVADCLIYRAA
jgi:PAS domain-containing protein